MRFEEFIERTSAVLRAAGVKRKRDRRVPLYLSMVMLEFDETLAPGRRRQPLLVPLLARVARRLPRRRDACVRAVSGSCCGAQRRLHEATAK